MDDAARLDVLDELGKVLLRIVVVHLRLFLGIEVVEVAEELVEAVIGRQHVVEVAEVVLAELAGGVALVLERAGDGDDFLVHADRRCRDADLRQAGAHHALPGDEGRPAGGAGLLTVAVGEHHAFLGDAVDVGRLVAHQTVRVATQVRDADIVAPDDEDVRLLGFGDLADVFARDIARDLAMCFSLSGADVQVCGRASRTPACGCH